MLILCVCSLLWISCETRTERAQKKMIDSLEIENLQNHIDYTELQEYISIIAVGLDSIAIEEHELLMNSTPGENIGFSRQRMTQNLNHVRELLGRHRDRIYKLEQKLDSQKTSAQYLRTIVISLRQQLEAKDRELAQLKADLQDNRKSLAVLQSRIEQVALDKEQMSQTINEQEEQLRLQNDKINTGYVKIASKKELKQLGILKGGFLRKKQINYSNIDLSVFDVVDTRTFCQIPVPDKFQIISSIPVDSYSVEEDSMDNNVIIIKNVEKFWSISKFLIIQTD